MSASRTLIHDRGSSRGSRPIQRDLHRSLTSRKWHLIKVDPSSSRDASADPTGANTNRQSLGLLESSDYIDAVVDAFLCRARTRNTVCGATRAAVGADTFGSGAIPETGALGVDGDYFRSRLESFDIVGKNHPPSIVGVGAVDVNFGSGLSYALGPDWSDVVG